MLQGDSKALSRSPIYDLTDEALKSILAHLSPKELIRAEAVCKWWNKISSDGELWKRHDQIHGLLNNSDDPQMSYKARVISALRAEKEEQSEDLSPIGKLPDEILVGILSHLSPKSLARAGAVSRCWRTVSEDDILWKRFALFLELVDEFSNRSRVNYKTIVAAALHPQTIEFIIRNIDLTSCQIDKF